MDQAEGFEDESDHNEKLVYKLNKSISGRKQSGKNWNDMLHNYLLAIDLYDTGKWLRVKPSWTLLSISSIYVRNCSLYTVLTATDQKPQKLQKGTIN